LDDRSEIELLKAAYEREKQARNREKLARKEAEKILEEKSFKFYEINKELNNLNINLSRFPDDNPTPIMSFSGDECVLIYTNKPGRRITNFIDANENLHSKIAFEEKLKNSYAKKEKLQFELKVNNVVYLISTVPNHSSNYVNLYGTDISYIKDAEQEIANTNIRLSTIITNLNAGILVESNKQIITLCNQKFCDLFSLPVTFDQLIDQNCSNSAEQVKNLFKEPEKFIDRINKITTAKLPVFSDVLEMVNGNILERDFMPIYFENKINGYIWQYRDITLEKKQANLTKQSEEKYRGILENMNLGLLEVGIEDEIIKAYPKFCELTGYDENELLGKSAIKMLLPDELKSVMSEEYKKREDGKSGVYEIQIKKKNDDLIWVIIGGAPFYNLDGELGGTIGIHLDITERKLMEQELRVSKLHAEQSSRAKEQFLANMSHEIRTPINGINGMARLMQGTILSEEQDGYISAIRTSVDNLSIIINDILDVSKIEAGKMTFENIGFNLKETLKQALRLIDLKAEEKGILLATNIDASIPEVVISDPTRINQVIINLLSNAVKFTTEGIVILNCSLVDKIGDKVRLKFEVIDTGIGIGKEKIEHVFENFSQEDVSTIREFGGTGLGLTISQQIVKLLDGELCVNSEKGKGSTFYFIIDLKVGTLADIPQKKSLPISELSLESVLNKKVLLVEDNRINQILTTNILKKWKMVVDLAVNGEMAIDKLKEQSYDVILMDMQMPIMGGMEAASIIRKELKLTTPIIALTAKAILGIKEDCLEIGMNDYISKPFDHSELFNKILNVINGEASLMYSEKEAVADQENYVSSKEELINVDNQLYDLTKLEKATGGDQAFMDHMIQVFLEDTPKDVEAMGSALNATDYEKVSDIAHQIKPSIRHMCIDQLLEAARSVELWEDKDEVMIEKTQQFMTNISLAITQIQDR
jgi:PAS domain S-box-containing protein